MKKKLSPLRLLFGAIGLAIGVVGVLALREATLSTHQRVGGRAVEVMLFAETKGGERDQTLDEMVEAQLLTCRLEVTSDLDGPIESLGDGERSRVTIELDFEGHGIGKLLVPLFVRRQARAEMPLNMQKLKERLESHG